MAVDMTCVCDMPLMHMIPQRLQFGMLIAVSIVLVQHTEYLKVATGEILLAL